MIELHRALIERKIEALNSGQQVTEASRVK